MVADWMERMLKARPTVSLMLTMMEQLGKWAMLRENLTMEIEVVSARRYSLFSLYKQATRQNKLS
jgi:hypothetical protein